MSLLDGDNLIQSPPSLFQKAKTLRDSKIVYRDRIASAESSPAMVGKTLLSLGNGKEGGSEEGEEEENTGDMDQPGGRGRTMTTNEEEREWEEEEEEQKELNLHASAFMRQRTCRDSKVVTRERSTEGRWVALCVQEGACIAKQSKARSWKDKAVRGRKSDIISLSSSSMRI